MKVSNNWFRFRSLISVLITSSLVLFSFSYFDSPSENISVRSVFSYGVSGKSPSFANAMQSFPWDEYKVAVMNKSEAKIIQHSESLLTQLLPFLEKSPAIPLNESCRAPPLKIPDTIRCHRLERPRKVGVLILFAFEADALEVHLNELDVVVDKFFIVESIRSHSRYLTHKHLMWDNLKSDERFSPFLSKIVHFVVDDANIPPPSKNRVSSEPFQEENLQEKLRWTKFLEWNAVTKYFDMNDLLGFGDVDEIPDRNVVYALKNCDFDTFPIDIGIWFPFRFINTIFRTDWPVPGHPYTLGDPTFWTLAEAIKTSEEKGNVPGRMRGRSPAFLLGGMHMSRYPYPPFELVKILCASEATDEAILKLIELGRLFSRNDTRNAAALFNNFSNDRKWEARIKSISNILEGKNKLLASEIENIVKIPWLIQCNPKRYPSLWAEGYDLRLED